MLSKHFPFCQRQVAGSSLIGRRLLELCKLFEIAI